MPIGMLDPALLLDPEELPTFGADLSLVTAFFNALPFLMSPKSAFLSGVMAGGAGGVPPSGGGIPGGGGGGGGGGPAMLLSMCCVLCGVEVQGGRLRACPGQRLGGGGTIAENRLRSPQCREEPKRLVKTEKASASLPRLR